jgi:DNA (cytosine-5)-methyltransferase 1
VIADDLFAGAGGWDLAAAQLGIHARGVENMKEARATRDSAGLTTIHDDVWTFAPDGKATGLIASPPCQTFSAAGKGNGRKALDDVLRGIRDGYVDSLDHLRFLGLEVGDERTALVLTPLHFALTGGYDWLAWEQVPTVLPVWEACAEVLRAKGWHVWTGLLHSEQYGVPQTRKRAFLLASRTAEVAPPTPTHSRYYSRTPGKLDVGVAKWVSMAEALGWGLSQRPSPTVTGGGTETGGAEPIAKIQERWANRADWMLRSPQTIAGGDRAERLGSEPSVTVTSNFDRAAWMQRRNSGPGAAREPRTVHEPAYTVRASGSGSHPCGIELLPDWCYNRPSTTIVGSFKPEIVAAPGYRTTVSRQNAPDSVRVTVEEAGVLQSFPADHPWQGAKGRQFLQCGNAVPPGMALHALAAAVGIERQEAVA